MMHKTLHILPALFLGFLINIPLSFSTGDPSVEFIGASGLDFLVEGCTDEDSIRITLDETKPDTFRFTIQLAGNADLNEDYQINFPPEIVFPPGSTTQSFPITPLDDAMEEGEEQIAINLLDTNDQAVASATVMLLDEVPVLINDGVKDTLYVCEDQNIDLNGSGAETYQWRPMDLFDDPALANQSISVTEDTWIYLDGTLGSCSATDSVFLRAVQPDPQAVASGPAQFCEGDSVRLELEADFKVETVTWSPEAGLDNPTSISPIAAPDTSTTYTATIFLDNCVAITEIEVEVDPFSFPNVADDTTICQNSPLQLATLNNPAPGVNYSWTPEIGIDSPGTATPTLIAEQTETYQLIAESENAYCADTATVEVEVLPADIEINNDDTVFLCKGDSVQLTTSSSGNGVSLEWTPSNGTLSSTTAPNVTAFPEVTTLYTVTFEADNGCVVSDSVRLRVDSLPAFEIENVPEPRPDCDKYCVGDIITLTTAPAPDNLYPDAEFMWQPADGSIQDSLTNLNVALEASTTQNYIRTTTNNACVERDTIEIEVVEPTIPISIMDTTVCENQPVDVSIDPTDLTDIQWMPEDMSNISCTSCPNPTITVAETTTFTVTATKEQCCPASASVTVNIPDPIDIPIDSVITCPGEPVQIEVDPPGDLENITWSPSINLSDPNVLEPTATVPQTTTFNLTGYIDDCRAEGTAIVETYDVSILQLTADSMGGIPQGATVMLMADLLPGENDPSFTWFDDGEMSDQTGNMAEFIVEEEGPNNLYSVTVIDDNGCELTQEILIEGIKPEVTMPNAFTPNNDDRNDTFRPVITGAEFIPNLISDFKIYNRWGNLVYDNQNPQQGWDGRYDGEPAPPDVYVYYVELTFPDGSSETLEGDVTLIR